MTTTSAPPAHRLRTGLVLAVGAALAMGGAAAAMKAMTNAGLPALHVVQARAVVGAAVLMSVALVLRRGRLHVPRRDWWLLGAYGVAGLAANHVVFTMSLSRLPVGVALLLEYLAPVLVALWVRFVHRRTVPAAVWLGTAVTLIGLGLVVRVWAGFALDGIGFGFALLAAVTMAARVVLADRGLRRHDPLVLAAWGTTVSGAALLLTGLVAPFPVDAPARAVDVLGTAVPMGVLAAATGVVGTAVAVLLAVAAQRLLPPTSASLVLTLEVVVGAVLAHVALGETLTAVQLLGGAVMLAGVAAAQVGIARRPPSP